MYILTLSVLLIEHCHGSTQYSTHISSLKGFPLVSFPSINSLLMWSIKCNIATGKIPVGMKTDHIIYRHTFIWFGWLFLTVLCLDGFNQRNTTATFFASTYMTYCLKRHLLRDNWQSFQPASKLHRSLNMHFVQSHMI